jgi:hypothetical protein
MSEPFDPYYRWLGIRDPERPPNHYRLLGLDLFEDNAEVISEAADRQMGHVRTHQTGKYSVLSQELLNELAKAKVCLLNRNRKVAYDGHLKDVLSKRGPILPQAEDPSTSSNAGYAEPPGHPTRAPATAPPPKREWIPPVSTSVHDTAEDTPRSGVRSGAPPKPLMITLTVLSGPQKGQIFEFSGRDTFTVGRSRQATFAIKGDKAFSRVHFSVRVNPPVVLLKNLNDKQGTRVNGKRVVETVLRDGDILSGGQATEIRVSIKEIEGAVPATPVATTTPAKGANAAASDDDDAPRLTSEAID